MTPSACTAASRDGGGEKDNVGDIPVAVLPGGATGSVAGGVLRPVGAAKADANDGSGEAADDTVELGTEMLLSRRFSVATVESS